MKWVTEDGAVQVRQLDAGRESLRFESPDGLGAFAFTPDGPRLACARPAPAGAGQKMSVKIIDVRNGKEVLAIPCDAGLVVVALARQTALATHIRQQQERIRLIAGRPRFRSFIKQFLDRQMDEIRVNVEVL